MGQKSKPPPLREPKPGELDTGYMPCRCGGEFRAFFGDEAQVVHTLPMCPQFEELDPVSFLVWVRTGSASHA